MAAEEDTTVLELEIGNVAGGGGCVARTPDGRVVFVRHSLPGERVMAKVTSSTRSYLRADAIEVLQPSPDRVSPPCPHAGPDRCGGCDFQHVDVAAQRRLKGFRIAEQLKRVAGIVREIDVEAVPGDVAGLGWRNRIRLAIDQDGRPGFRQHRSHEIEYVNECPIASPWVNGTGVFDAQWPGFDELDVMVGSDGRDAVVSLQASRKVKLALPDLGAGVVARGRVLRQPGSVQAVVSGFTFRITAGVFWQVHVGAASALCLAVVSALGTSPGESVVDLYAGAGLFSVVLADAVGPRGSLLAVERDRRACADAEHNGSAFPQLRVLKASVTPELVERGIGRADLIVLDPAREGAGTAVMEAIGNHGHTVRKVAYVSCDPATFSRDIRPLLARGWTLSTLRAFDIFPMTEHVELVATLTPPP
ncbi:MAG TPA: TRAM domain-containing protein [Acidimicrobiales bacterium]|nr:TRAM domain-containing protein [Acidimicrobiales bacterium]